MSKKTIVIVEDEPMILANYRAALDRQGYKTIGYSDLPSAKNLYQKDAPDLVIIDVGLGNELDGGFELCRLLRVETSELPILFLTARDDEIDVVSGLRLGADDYLSKEISLPHLMARIAALFRRQDLPKTQSQQKTMKIGDVKVLLDSLQLYYKEQLVDLTVTEFWMLVSLLKFPGHVKSRAQLMDDSNIYVDQSTITSHIKRIRKKFVALDSSFSNIDTVHGMGYRWKV